VPDLLHLGVHEGIEGPQCQLDHKHRDEKPCKDPAEKQVDDSKKYDKLGYRCPGHSSTGATLLLTPKCLGTDGGLTGHGQAVAAGRPAELTSCRIGLRRSTMVNVPTKGSTSRINEAHPRLFVADLTPR
jgi:hypothetical protein